MRTLDHCIICKELVPAFSITPLLEDEKGNLNQCCEICADEHFPGWNDEEEELEE